MTVCLGRIASLPNGFDGLRADAEADGFRHMRRLAAEFETMREMFHAVLAAFINGGLAGIGGITDQPQPTSALAWRMRRLYVHRGFRRRGVARAIRCRTSRGSSQQRSDGDGECGQRQRGTVLGSDRI
jgi:hypothetical protein